MHVLKFGGASASSDYSYLAGWYYAVGVQHGERSYFCCTNGRTPTPSEMMAGRLPSPSPWPLGGLLTVGMSMPAAGRSWSQGP